MIPMPKFQPCQRGFSLAEVLITLAIMGFAIPWILVATRSTLSSRQTAELDTRANWIVRDVQQRLMMKWASGDQASGIDQAFPFPVRDSPGQHLELLYDQHGESIRAPISQAVYLVRIDAEHHESPQAGPLATERARIRISVQQPANGPEGKRNKRAYEYLATRGAKQ
ncbi:MAG: hypothetical protein RL346_1199 [Verrucomicrobiota bacterium]|jgi:prepilin-type N-terminal cleavage/methylation domain-containing protein